MSGEFTHWPATPVHGWSCWFKRNALTCRISASSSLPIHVLSALNAFEHCATSSCHPLSSASPKSARADHGLKEEIFHGSCCWLTSWHWLCAFQTPPPPVADYDISSVSGMSVSVNNLQPSIWMDFSKVKYMAEGEEKAQGSGEESLWASEAFLSQGFFSFRTT